MKNRPIARDKQGPAPIVATCADCGTDFHSKFERKRHVCRKENRHGEAR